MLVLTRKQNEEIVIDGHIIIKVLRVKGNAIRLGIDAPKDVPVRRGELVVREVPPEGRVPPTSAAQVGPKALGSLNASPSWNDQVAQPGSPHCV